MQDKINTRDFKRQLTLGDCEKVLGELKIPIYTKGDKTWRLYTGCHHKNAYDGGHNLIFYTDTKSFQCVTQCSCSFDIIGLCQRRLKLLNKPCSFMDAIAFIGKATGKEVSQYKRISKNPDICDWSGMERFLRVRRGDSALTVFNSDILKELEPTYYQGWIDEGISVATQKKFGIRYYRRTNQICIPCRNREGGLIGIRCRNLEPERLETAKYIPLITLNGKSYAFPTNQVFYGINYTWEAIERTGQICIAESEKSVLKAEEFLGRDNNCVALYGSQLGLRRRNEIIKMGVKEVVLCLDSDFESVDSPEYDKFEKKMFELGKMFKGYCNVSVVYNNLGWTNWNKCSPFDGTKEQWNMLYENREGILS